ncbi:MAG TPA: hypothetical protein DDY14_09260, partial [Chromatiaceae bacterium]|nr:hypothetical protein [Chromatiaceae bacterium]
MLGYKENLFMNNQMFSTDTLTNPLDDIAGRVKGHCQNTTRSLIKPVADSLRGLMQADPNKKNMERMEERVPDSDEQQLRQMLTDSEIVKLFKPQIRHRWYT